tara:strand:- start:1786 stop:2400 length:615 start_codon:yes stop_codon:yes gene_type:complete
MTNLLNNMDLLNYFIKNDIKDFSNNENDICLITNASLEKNHITLDCNHKFNYIPLYYELLYQKRKKILDNKNLKISEIKCPYCRNITNKLIPYYKYYDIKKLSGINYPEKYCMKINECSYVKNNIKCNNSACNTNYGLFCNKHFKYNINEETIINNISINDYNKYKKKTVVDLKNILKENSYKTSGNKEDLINRILINIKNIEI